MLTMKELNPTGEAVDDITWQNMEILLFRINEVEKAYGKKLTVTSGIRSMKTHLRIYAQKNAKLKAEGKPEVKVPLASKHLYGQAVDIADADDKLWAWCMKNLELLAKLGLWLEDKAYTDTWVHFQIVPPKSGKQIFVP